MDDLSTRLWDNADIQRFLHLGKSATNEVMASHDFPAPVVGNRRYRRYMSDDIVQWAINRAALNTADRRSPRVPVT